MKRLSFTNRVAACLYAYFVLYSASAVASESVNVWVVNPQTQAVTTYSVGGWVQDYAELPGFSVGSPLQVLVNGLPNSSVPMSPMQAGASIIGFGKPDRDSASYSGVSELYVFPASGSSTQTIEVLMQVSALAVDQGQAQLMWQINGGPVSDLAISPFDEPNANGLYDKRIYLIADGNYEVVVSLRQAGQIVSEQRLNYTVTSSDPLKEKRDSDGDGVPDLIEAEIGLDPFNAELFTDANGDGWSEFDIWLRCDDIVISNCGLPADTDGDGWSDFDELIRGTRHNDFVLPVPNGSDQDEESYNQNKLLLQQRPAARRLYEIEYVLRDNLGSNKFTSIQVAELNGMQLFDLNELANDDDLLELSVNAAQVNPAILRSTALENLAAANWPEIRLGASKTLAIRGSHNVESPAPSDNPSQAVSLLVLEGKGDVNIQNFPASLDGQWQNTTEWRTLLRTWLSQQLVITEQTPFTEETTAAALLFEVSLREEALLLGENEAIRLGVEGLPATWINTLALDMREREQKNLFNWYTRILSNLDSNASYAGLSLATDLFIISLPNTGTNTSEWLIQRLRMPVDLSAQGCFVQTNDLAFIQADPDYFLQWQIECPQYYTEVELAAWQAQASALRYLLRMTMYTEGPQRIAQSTSLAAFADDSDADTLSNFVEVLQSPYDTATYPWREDSDGDGFSDFVDECRNDALNLCAGDPIQPTLALGSDINANIGNQGGLAFLELVLSSPALQTITFTYFIEAVLSEGDDAVDGIDFEAISGTLSFAPGQQSIIIPAYLLANEMAANARFRIRIEGLVGASLASNDNVQLVNINRSISSAPNIVLAADTLDVDERAVISFDASLSTSGISDPSISYLWTQTSGPTASISAANTDSVSITAPVVTDNISLSFMLSAQNTDGVESSASVTLNVNPVDDPPLVSGMPSYTVARDGNLIISLDSLLAFVSEPDGETLTITQLIQTTDSGTIFQSTEGFEYTPDTATGRLVTQLENDPIDIRSYKGDGLVYRTANTAVSPRVYKIHTWTPEAGNQTIDESNFSYSGILANDEQDIIYYGYTNSDTSTTFFKWRLADDTFGEINTGGFATLFGAQIDGATGSLYHCLNDRWERIDPQRQESQRLSLSCNRFAAAQASIDDKFCLTGEDGLYCSNDGVAFDPVFLLPESFANIDRVFSSDIGTLVLYNDNINQFIAHVDGQTNGQVLYTLDNYFNFIQGLWVDNAFYTLLPVAGDGFSEGVQLFRWRATDTQLLALGDASVLTDELSRNDLSQFIPLGDNFLWFGQKSGSVNAKYLINSDTGEFTQVGEDIAGSRTLHAWKDSALFSSERLESACQWFELDASGQIADINNPELARAGCFGRLVYGNTLAYTLFDSNLGFNEFFAKYGATAASQTQFTVRVEDENGNAVDLVATINITEGAN
jgi:hypothetical protein